MARLSEEHFKCNPATPTASVRGSNRFKGIFKPRFSLSSKDSIKVLAESPPSGSPTAVSGGAEFSSDRVTVLPNKRGSNDSLKVAREKGKASGVELAAALKDVSVPSNMYFSFADFDGSRIVMEEGSKNANSKRLINDKIGLADMEQSHSDESSGSEDTKSEVPCTPKSAKQNDPATIVKNDIEDPAKLPVCKFSQDFDDHSSSIYFFSNSTDQVSTDGNGPVIDSTLPDAADENSSSLHRSFASNIFDDNDSMSRGIREYVESKIAEAMVEQERKTNALVSATPSQVHVTFDFHRSMKAGDLLQITGHLFQETGKCSPTFNILDGPKYIGPMTINHPCLASNIQSLVITVYLIIISVAAFLGPKALVLTLWRMGVMLVVYMVTGRYLGWCEDAQKEVLLAPVAYTTGVLETVGKDIFLKLREIVAHVLVDAAQISSAVAKDR